MTNFETSAALPLVKANDFQRLWHHLGPEILEAVRAVGESGWWILGAETERFERDLAAFWSRRFAVGVASGLDAIEIGLRCVGCRPGDRVLLPAVSAFATALAIIRIGAVPVFADCDRFGLLDLDLAEDALRADPSIRFAVPVHLYGHCLDMARLGELRRRFEFRMVEDCAQSIGALHNGTPSGAAGDCAAVSFYPTKNLGAMGDGGALLTDTNGIASLARALRDYGQSAKYRHEHAGLNSRLDELQSAILDRVFLPRVREWNAVRRQIAARYIAEIRNERIEVPGAPPGSDSCWHLFPVLVAAERKGDFLAHLRANGIAAGEHYPAAMVDQPAVAEVPHACIGKLGNARDWCAREVSLPVHPYLSEEEVGRVISACSSWR